MSKKESNKAVKLRMEKEKIKEALKEALPEVLNELTKTGRIKIEMR